MNTNNPVNQRNQQPQRREVDRFELVVERTHEKMKALAETVESISPHHPFGHRVFAHMVALHCEAPQLVNSENISHEHAKLVTTTLAIHDIGRLVCQIQKPGDREFQHQHGEIGAQYLRENSLLRGLSEEEVDVVLKAVEFHGVKTVNLPEDSLAFQICSLVRDLDRFTLLDSNENFMSPRGILHQVSMWMLGETDKKALESLSSDERHELNTKIQQLINEGINPSVTPDALTASVFKHMTRKIPEDQIAKVLRGELLTKEDSIYGYPSYMLSHLAQLNDIKSLPVLRKIAQTAVLETRFKYLENVAPDLRDTLAILRAKLRNFT